MTTGQCNVAAQKEIHLQPEGALSHSESLSYGRAPTHPDREANPITELRLTLPIPRRSYSPHISNTSRLGGNAGNSIGNTVHC